MSPVSRSRKPKRPTKPVQHAPASPYAKFVDEAKALLDPETEVVEAELWGSFALGALFESSWFGGDDDEDPDDVFEEMYEDLVGYLAKQKRRPEALAGLRALAMVGEDWTREQALAAADDLAATGIKEPGWLSRAEEVVPTSVFRAGDLFGDAGTVNLGFRRGGEEHTVSCYVADRGGPVLERVLVVPGGAADLAKSMREQDDEEETLHVSELTPVAARTLLAEALDQLLSEGPDDPEELRELAEEAGLDLEELEMTSPVGLWALLAARLELLPEPEVGDTALGSEQDVRDTVAAFLGSPQAAELDHDLAGALVTVFADAAALSDRTAIGFGPISLGGFLLDEFIETVELTESEVAHVPAVLEAWAEFTNERRGFGEEGLRQWQRALPQLSKAFIEVYLDEDNADLREEAEAVPVREYQVCAGTDLSELLQQILDEAKAEGEDDEEDDEEDEDDDDVEWVREPGSADSPDTDRQ